MHTNEDRDILRVCHKQCDQCLYGNNKIVSDSRKKDVLQELEQENDYFICHKASIAREKVMCRGYYEGHKTKSILILLGHSLKTIRFVDVMEVMRSGVNKMRQSNKS